MEADSKTTKASSLRWKILRRALLRKPSSLSDEQSEAGLKRVSRKSGHGFNLIPCHVVEDDQLGSSKDACFRYVLPVPNSPCIRLRQRVDGGADLNDFEVCNRHSVDNTGLVCQWPSEDVLAYYSLSNADMFRSKRVIELGSGYGLAGLVIAAATEAVEVVITDGNPQVVDYIQRSIDANSGTFDGTEVKSMVLHWNHLETTEISSSFDIIVASDCTFFKEFHEDLARTIRILLRKDGLSEAILLSPKRGDSLDKFLREIENDGLNYTITETYNSEVWRLHETFLNGDESWPNYDKNHCYPLLISSSSPNPWPIDRENPPHRTAPHRTTAAPHLTSPDDGENPPRTAPAPHRTSPHLTGRRSTEKTRTAPNLTGRRPHRTSPEHTRTGPRLTGPHPALTLNRPDRAGLYFFYFKIMIFSF